MTKPKKSRCDTVAGIVEIAKNLETKIESPIALSEEEGVLFDEIIKCLPVDCWDVWRVQLAANLAKMQIYAQVLFQQTVEEGPTIMGVTGPRSNPTHSGYLQLIGKIVQVSNTLGLSASSQGVVGRDLHKRKDAEKEVRALMSKAKGNDLLA